MKQTESKSFKYIIIGIATLFALFQLYTSGFGLMTEINQRAIHMIFVFTLIFLLYPTTKLGKLGRVVDLIFLAISVTSMVYIVINYDAIILRGGIPNTLDMFFGLAALSLVLEATRRAAGIELAILAVIFVLYAFWGPYMPGAFAHKGFSLARIVDHLYMSLEGIFGIAIAVSATFLYLFVLFGSLLSECGALELFKNLGMALAGGQTGGPAKVATIMSGLMGTVSGSSPANVAATGCFTIPLMKSLGYSGRFAGAVEAVASTGGQLMPPVMGVAAFIMTAYLKIPYLEVVKAGFLPAILFYIALWSQIHYHSLRQGWKGIPRKDLPKAGPVLKQNGHLLLPLLLIIILIMTGISPLYAAFFGVVGTIAISWLKKDTRLTAGKILNAFEDAARSVIPISIATAVVGIIIGVVSLTGTALLVGNQIVMIAQGNLILAMFLIMIVCIVLGMGLPTSAVYIVSATFAAPVLVKLGVPLLAAHFFVFYYGSLSAVTPPVALASFVGAGIAGEKPSAVGILAFRLALAGYLVPFIFVFSPNLLLIGDSVFTLIWASITAIIGTIALGIGLEGYFRAKMHFIERIIAIAGAVMVIYPDGVTDIIGAVLLVLVGLYNWRKSKKDKNMLANTATS